METACVSMCVYVFVGTHACTPILPGGISGRAGDGVQADSLNSALGQKGRAGSGED